MFEKELLLSTKDDRLLDEMTVDTMGEDASESQRVQVHVMPAEMLLGGRVEESVDQVDKVPDDASVPDGVEDQKASAEAMVARRVEELRIRMNALSGRLARIGDKFERKVDEMMAELADNDNETPRTIVSF